MDLPRLCLSEANLDHITELGTRDAHREDAESRRWCVNARHTQAHRLIHKLQPLHPQMSSSLRNLSSVWDYLCLILSPAPTEMPEGAGGVRMTCRALRAADWIQAGPWKIPENSHWSRHISIFIMPRLHSPGWSLLSVSSHILIDSQILLWWYYKLGLIECVEMNSQHK